MSKGQYFFDDGTEYNPDLYSRPGLCLTCKKDEDPKEEILCSMNRMDQHGKDEFVCFAYEKK